MAAPKPAARVERTTFRTSRALDFASVEELTRETGQPPEAWPLVILKELVDNSLDATEEHGIAPVIAVTVDEGGITVTDNGPGLPPETVAGVVDFENRVSSRAAYVAPDRGAQGNALKTIVAMPFVLGTGGGVTVRARGVRHRITLGLDALRQHVEVQHATADDPLVRSGTAVTVESPWSDGDLDEGLFLQKANEYVALNPHLALSLTWYGEELLAAEPVAAGWGKWLPSRPTSPHWYTSDRLRDLILAYLRHDAKAGRASARTAREFVSLFHGLSGTAKQKAVLDATGLHRAPLRSLVGDDGPDEEAIRRLLLAMRGHSRPVPPRALGPIGEANLRWRFVLEGGAPGSFRYHRAEGSVTTGGAELPYLIEAAFAHRRGAGERRLLTGVNWSAGYGNPFRRLGLGYYYGDGLDALLQEQRAGPEAEVVIALHLAMPGVAYTDRGKTAVALPDPVGQVIREAVTAVTKRWAAQARREERDASARLRREVALDRDARAQERTQVELVASIMVKAYRAASDGGKLPVHKRQLYYAVRRFMLRRFGVQVADKYFNQTLLPDYLDAHPDETGTWRVYAGPRGQLVEPHTGRAVPLGTEAVEDYLGNVRSRGARAAAAEASGPIARVPAYRCPTVGPARRYRFILFTEKEGFDPLYEEVELGATYDIALMSTKGTSVIAARHLLDRLAALGEPPTVLILHDFDVNGVIIRGTLAGEGGRYTYANKVRFIDLGLRLTDVEEWGLTELSEPVVYKGGFDGHVATLRRYGATAPRRGRSSSCAPSVSS